MAQIPDSRKYTTGTGKSKPGDVPFKRVTVPTPPTRGTRSSSPGGAVFVFGLICLGVLAIAIGANQAPSNNPAPPPPSVQPQVNSRSPAPPQPPQPKQISVAKFLPLVLTYPRPGPPITRSQYWPDFEVWQWGGRSFRLRHAPTKPDGATRPYIYLCVVNGGLDWCWPNPPIANARDCTNNTGIKGWCWQELEWR